MTPAESNFIIIGSMIGTCLILLLGFLNAWRIIRKEEREQFDD